MKQKSQNNPSPFTSWVQEMAHRHVFRVLAIYVAVGWGFTEIIQGVVEQVGAPPAISTFVTIVFILGFPVVLFLAWMFDVDKNGVHRIPTRGKGQLLISMALAILLSASYGIYRYLPRDQQSAAYEIPDEIVLAVLPFKNLSAADDYDFLGHAIAEDLLNGVAIIPDLRVKATFSSFALQQENHTAFAEQLGVNRILDGTYRQQDGNLRLSARLVDTNSGDVVWTRSLTDSISNIYMIEDQIAKDIASEFGMTHPYSAKTTSRKVDPQVYQLYLQAREGMVNPWLDTMTTMAKLQQILDAEPNFPEALSAMGFLHTGSAWVMEDRHSPWLKTGAEYSLKALEINTDLPEAYAVLALNYSLQYRWSESRHMADKAIEVAGPRPINVIYTFAYNNLGHKSKSLEILQRVFEEDPLNDRAIQDLMVVYADLEMDDKALQVEQILISRKQRYQRHYLTQVYAREGDLETARQLAGLFGGEHGFGPEMGEHILDAWMTGRSEVFEKATEEMLEAGTLPLGQAIWNLMAAGADEDKVFHLVSEAIPKGQFNQISLFHAGAARYRQDPRFLQTYADLGMVDYWKSIELPDFCDEETIRGLCE